MSKRATQRIFFLSFDRMKKKTFKSKRRIFTFYRWNLSHFELHISTVCVPILIEDRSRVSETGMLFRS